MLFDNLTAIASRAPSTSGLRIDGRTERYDDLAERALRLAGGFASQGIAPGDAVAILMPNGPELVGAVYGLFALGAIAMPLSTTATASEIAVAGRKGRIKALLVKPELAGLAAGVAAELGTDRPLAVLVGGDDGALSLGRLARTAPSTLTLPPASAHALYLTSSGSTGMPKIVPHTHAELLADGRRTSGAWGLTGDDIVFDMLPSNFAMGLLLGATNAAEAGATTVYWNDPRPLLLSRAAVLDTIVDEGVTFMGAVPTMYETLAGGRAVVDLSAIRIAFSGGAALRREVFDAVKAKFGLTLRQSYGSTEAIFVAHNDTPDPERDWASVGRPAGDAEVRLSFRHAGLPDGVGELMIKSSSVTRGYLDDAAANAATFEDGWLFSGDLARLDDEGRIVITGRSKLLIEVSGFKIDPIEVEDTLRQHPAVAEAVVIGFNDGSFGGQRLKAVVIPADDVTPDALSKFLRGKLSVQKVPTVFEFRTELPRSSAGKVLRSKLTEEA
jgi:acyl-CoA synthetase (AMP-forming)/AMP-acid ligase II